MTLQLQNRFVFTCKIALSFTFPKSGLILTFVWELGKLTEKCIFLKLRPFCTEWNSLHETEFFFFLRPISEEREASKEMVAVFHWAESSTRNDNFFVF